LRPQEGANGEAGPKGEEQDAQTKEATPLPRFPGVPPENYAVGLRGFVDPVFDGFERPQRPLSIFESTPLHLLSISPTLAEKFCNS